MCASDAALTGGEYGLGDGKTVLMSRPAHGQVSSGREPLPRCCPKDTTTRPGMRRSTRISPIRQSRDERAHDRSTPAQLDQGCTSHTTHPSLPISQPTRGNTSQPNSKTAPPFGNLPLSFLSSAIAPRVRMPHTHTNATNSTKHPARASPTRRDTGPTRAVYCAQANANPMSTQGRGAPGRGAQSQSQSQAALHCTALRCAALCCAVLRCAALCCAVLRVRVTEHRITYTHSHARQSHVQAKAR
jgi:hypothetical protein